MADNSKNLKQPSDITLRAQAVLDAQLTQNAPHTLYIAGYHTLHGKHVALQRCRESILLWTEAVADAAPAEFQKHLKIRYAKDKSRSSNLNGKNASRLKIGNPIDYWEFHSVHELSKFIEWYKK
jgi:hypothetical protein